MTTKPTPTRKPTGRKAERPRQRWRALKAGDVLTKGWQFQKWDYMRRLGPWEDGSSKNTGNTLTEMHLLLANYRAPVTATAKGRRK